MSIADQINRLNNAKANIKQAIENKGVTVSDSALLDEYPALIDSIPMEGGNPFYETMWNVITNNNTDYQYLFFNSNSTEIDVSNLDTSKVTNMSYMFSGCTSLTELDVSSWDTSNVTDMNNIFVNCLSLISLDLSNFDTSNVTNMRQMFQNCSRLTELDLSNFDTSNVTDMYYMFNGCQSLTSLDVSNLDTSKVTNMSYMFYNCESLTSLDVSNWDTSNVTNMNSIFGGCFKLTSLDISNFDVSKCTSSSSLSNIFGTSYNGCTALVDFIAPKNISAPMNVQYATALSHDSLMSIINNLATVSGKTLTLGSTNKAKLTEEELAIATNKGWKIA